MVSILVGGLDLRRWRLERSEEAEERAAERRRKEGFFMRRRKGSGSFSGSVPPMSCGVRDAARPPGVCQPGLACSAVGIDGRGPKKVLVSICICANAAS